MAEEKKTTAKAAPKKPAAPTAEVKDSATGNQAAPKGAAPKPAEAKGGDAPKAPKPTK